MTRFALGLLALATLAAPCSAGVVVSAPGTPANYLAVQFVAGEDQPTIKADGLTTSNGYVWVEKADPIFGTEFVGYDYPFAVHDLSAFTALSGGVIEVGQGNGFREVKYFDNDWAWFPWTASPAPRGVPEPSSLALAALAICSVGFWRRSL